MKSTFTLKESAKVFLLTMFLLIASIKTFAYDFEIDGICYRVSSEIDHECAVTGYKEITNNNLIIPASITWNNIKYSVVSIEKEAFKSCSKVTSIVIPESVTSIGSSAFEGCSSLVSVLLPDDLSAIKSNAFKGCSSLASVLLPNNLSVIEQGAFYGCI